MKQKNTPDTWRQEYLEKKAGLSPCQMRVLAEGPKSLSQAWALQAHEVRLSEEIPDPWE